MGNTCTVARPPAYAERAPHGTKKHIKAAAKRASVGNPDQVLARALNTALMAFANSDSMESYDAVVQHRKSTVQALSGVFYGKPIKWMSIVAYVMTALELDPEWLVLPEKYAAPFLDTQEYQASPLEQAY